MEDNVQKAVQWEDKCPICKKSVKFKITKDSNRTYRAYIIDDGCEHFAPGFIDQSKYRLVCHMLTQLFQEPDLLYARMKKKEEVEKMKLLGIDVSKFL